MNQIQQAKQGLLIYLQANATFIQQKIYNQFNIQCIKNHKLNTLDVKKMSKSIKEIFDFGQNKIYKYFFDHLQENINNYIKQQYKSKAVESFYVLDIQKLTDIIKYCIKHGFDLNAAAQFKDKLESKEKQVVVIPPPKPIKKQQPKVQFVQIQKKPQPIKDEFAYVKPRVSTFLQRDKIPEKKQFKLQKFEMPNVKVAPRYLASIPKVQPKQEIVQTPPLVEALDLNFIARHQRSMQERLQSLFNFYCFQQQSLGQGPTFDRMKLQGQQMNLGNFLKFCQATKVFDCKEISKDSLISSFKKGAEGKIQIMFPVFEQIIQKIDEQYLQVMGNCPQNPVPTYQARLLLNEPGKLGSLKKARNLIFGTRSKQGRQILHHSETERYQKKQLTLHSGRFSSDLVDIKQKAKAAQVTPKKKPRKLQDTTIHLNDLKKLRLPRLTWIGEDEQQQIPKPVKKK